MDARRQPTNTSYSGTVEQAASKKECSIWSGSDHIADAFDALGEPSDVPIATYLNSKRVVVKNDPVLIEVFGEDAVRRYEHLLATADA